MSDSEYNKIIRDFAQTIKDAPNSKTSPYDTQAEVKRIDGDTAWVHIPGGVDETPVQLTTNAKKGDIVQVRVSGGRAWLYGNATAPPTDDTRANEANKVAVSANEHAINAVTEAGIAKEAADSAQASAATAEATADSAYGEAIISTKTYYAYAEDISGNNFSVSDDSLPYRGIYIGRETSQPEDLTVYKWEINPLWASKFADNYIHKWNGSLAIFDDDLDSNTYAGISALALTFFLNGVQQMKVGYDASLEEYGVIAESILAAGNGAGVRFDNTLEADARGRFIWEIRNNGHLSLKRY